MTTWLLIIGLLYTAYFLYYYFKKHFLQTPLFRVFVSMVSYVLIALAVMILLTWPSFIKRFSMEVLLIGLFLLFFHGINKLYPMTFYKYPGCSIVVTALLYLMILIILMGLVFQV